MFVSLILIASGAAVAVVGVRLATERRRPASLAGALLAPTGLVLVLLGAAALVHPGFWSR